MKLEDAVCFGKEVGLLNVEEITAYIDMHAMELFSYDDMLKELNEMYSGYKNLCDKHGYDIAGKWTPDEYFAATNNRSECE